MSTIKDCIDLNRQLYHSKLVIDTFGNLSERIDKHHFCIKPSGVNPDSIEQEDVPVIEISSGSQVGGRLKASSDTPTHLKLYREYNEIGGIVHTHSLYATSWAQAGNPITNLGTTHSDYWLDDIPVTRKMTDDEINSNYEFNTGKVIVESLRINAVNPASCPGILVQNHGPFTWGVNGSEALKNAEILEFVAQLAINTLNLKSDANIGLSLKEKHYFRKHGPNAYYGQNNK